MAKKKAASDKPPETDVLGRRVDQAEYERHLALARGLGLRAEDLEEEVHRALARVADLLNDKDEGGLESQLAFLLNESGALLEEDLRNVAELKGPQERGP